MSTVKLFLKIYDDKKDKMHDNNNISIVLYDYLVSLNEDQTMLISKEITKRFCEVKQNQQNKQNILLRKLLLKKKNLKLKCAINKWNTNTSNRYNNCNNSKFMNNKSQSNYNSHTKNNSFSNITSYSNSK